MHPEPLQTGQDRRQLVPAPEGQANLFDGRDLEIGLGLEGVAHGRKQWRMLQGQTPESPQTFNRSSNIRTLPFASNPMRARSFPALAAHSLTPRFSGVWACRPGTSNRFSGFRHCEETAEAVHTSNGCRSTPLKRGVNERWPVTARRCVKNPGVEARLAGEDQALGLDLAYAA